MIAGREPVPAPRDLPCHRSGGGQRVCKQNQRKRGEGALGQNVLAFVAPPAKPSGGKGGGGGAQWVRFASLRLAPAAVDRRQCAPQHRPLQLSRWRLEINRRRSTLDRRRSASDRRPWAGTRPPRPALPSVRGGQRVCKHKQRERCEGALGKHARACRRVLTLGACCCCWGCGGFALCLTGLLPIFSNSVLVKDGMGCATIPTIKTK